MPLKTEWPIYEPFGGNDIVRIMDIGDQQHGRACMAWRTRQGKARRWVKWRGRSEFPPHKPLLFCIFQVIMQRISADIHRIRVVLQGSLPLNSSFKNANSTFVKLHMQFQECEEGNSYNPSLNTPIVRNLHSAAGTPGNFKRYHL